MPTSISNGESGLSVRTKLNTIWTNLVTSGLTVDGDVSISGGANSFGTTATSAYILRTGAGGSAPFTQAGSLLYQPRTSTTDGRSNHLFYTGDPLALRMNIQPTGNINFYEDTGTTAKLVWDAAAESLTVNGDVNIDDAIPILRLDSPATTWSGGEDLGGLDWYTKDTSGNGPAVMARIYSESSGTNTLPIPNMIFQTSEANVLLKDRMKIAGNGDISFYEDTGTTAKLTWDASEEDLKFADDSKAIFGTDSDLQIYHDGSNARIREITGELRLQTTSSGVNALVAKSNAAVELFHSGSIKAETTATGIDVTGTVTADGLTVGGASAGRATLGQFTNTTNAGGTEAAIDLRNQAGGNADVSLVASRTGANFGSDFYIETSDGVDGTNRKRLNVGENGDISFYEDTGTTAKFFWDASTESLGIGTSPAYVLDVTGATATIGKFKRSSAGTTEVLIDTSGSGDAKLVFADNGTDSYAIGRDNTNGDLVIAASGELGTSNLINIESGGNVGISTSVPADKLHVEGNIYLGASDRTVYTGGAGNLSFQTNTGEMSFLRSNGSAESMRIDNSGNVLVGTTDDQPSNNSAGSTADNGLALKDNGELQVAAYKNTANSGSVGYFNRTSTDGTIINFLKDGATIGGITATQGRLAIGNGDTGLKFSDANESIMPFNVSTNANRDNAVDLGYTTVRFNDVYATNGTIQTSDQTEKQDIAALTSTEMLVGKRISALFKTFRWKDKVASKGDNARTHTGIIAQDVQAAFTAEGLDAGDYSLFISSTWLVDSEGNEVEEGTEDAVSKTRMGIRYPELLSFVAAYNEQRFANIETRLTTLEG